MSIRKTAAAAAAMAMLFTGAAAAEALQCKVVGVSDGDTLTCLTAEKRQIKVRLAQIDAPESSQAFGQRAKKALSDRVFGKAVSIEPETTDRYGRTVATVWSGGQDVNLKMIETGMAWVYQEYARDPAYFAAHDAAKAGRVGLWSDANPVRPSEFRRGQSGGSGAAATTAAPKVMPIAASGGFSCEGKRYCGQMTSCSEARYYLERCGVLRLDRDRDGIPCESICR